MNNPVIVHRLNDDAIIELRECIAALAFAVDSEIPERVGLVVEFVPIHILITLINIEIGEWTPEYESADDLLTSYCDLVQELLDNRMTPNIRDAFDRVVAQLSDMIETSWSPLSASELNGLIDNVRPVSNTDEFITERVEVSVNPITYIARFVPSFRKETRICH